MGRPRTPTAILEARGAFRANPKRRKDRLNEVQPEGELGPAPRSLGPRQKKLWNELAEIIPSGVAFACDRWTLEIAAKLMEKERRDAINTVERGQLITCLSKMGMTPSDRSKVQARPQQKKSKWAEFAGQSKEETPGARVN